MRRTEYGAGQAAKRLKVSAAAFRWVRHAGLIPDPDVSSWQWSRAAVEALDADAIRAAMPSPPISGGAAADRIADALDTPNVIDEKANVTAFVVRRFVDRGLLTDLSANPDGTLHHPGQVAEVCRREDLANPVAADTPLGPEQAAARLRVRRAGAVDVALYRSADVDALPAAHPEVDWEQLRAVEKGRRSPLAALSKQAAPA